MNRLKLQTLLCLILVLITNLVVAQSITGTILSEETKEPVVGTKVTIGNDQAYTNATGKFRFFNINNGVYDVVVELGETVYNAGNVTVNGSDVNLGNIYVNHSESAGTGEIAVVDLNLIDDADDDSQVSSILTASRDPFQQAAAYNLSAGRYRIRGYQSRETEVNLNGFPVNDTEDGGYYWGTWGGLNDVFRNQENTTNLDATAYSFGGLGGATQIDLRASVQRPQLKIVNDFGNRSYQFRHMVTYSTGETDSGWSYSLSASKRWGKRGYAKGTFYDAYSYFASIEKKINDAHSVNFVALGAPSYRGRSSASTQEMYDLVGDNYYNPNWGYSNGKIVNARAYNFHQPIFMLRHDWNLSDKITLTSNLAYKTGYNGSTGLNWTGRTDPRPDYYYKLPSNNLSDSTLYADRIVNDVNYRQLNFDAFWRANVANKQTIENVNGTTETVTGAYSQYIIGEKRYDDNKISFNTNITAVLSDKITFNGGLSYLNEQVDNYTIVKDLIGGDFFVDWNKFASTTEGKQNNLIHPNRVVKEGDRFGYDYSIISNKYNGWGQVQAKLEKLDLFASANLTSTSFYRKSYVKNGNYPDESYGKSATKSFLNYGVKLGGTYKLDGRNYFYGIATARTRAPFSRQVFVAPRSRNQILDGLKDEEMYGGELGYVFRYPGIKGKIAGYYTLFKNQLETRNMYYENVGFGSYILKNVEKLHKGVEFGLQYKATQTVTVSFAGAVGAQQYANNPTSSFIIDDTKEVQPEKRVYIKNMYLGGPQTGLSLGLDYRSPKFWFARLSLNHFRGMYLSIFPDRRTKDAVSGVVYQGEDYYSILNQTKFKNQFTMDLFTGKSFKLNKSFVFAYLSVSNLFNNKDFITGGYEQSRFGNVSDLTKFQPRLYYAYGINYSLGLQFRL